MDVGPENEMDINERMEDDDGPVTMPKEVSHIQVR